jgi:hypothetical protein
MSIAIRDIFASRFPQHDRDGLRDVERIFDIKPSPHRRRVAHDQAGALCLLPWRTHAATNVQLPENP